MRDAKELRREVLESLAGADGRWDVDAIVAGINAESIDDMPDGEYWRLVAAHELPDPEPPADAFRRELSAAIAGQRAGRDALWTDGVVTVRARGVSRVNQELPQPLARFTVETAGEAVTLGGSSSWESVTWDRVWDHVLERRQNAEAAQARAVDRLKTAAGHCSAAADRAAQALRERDTAVRDALAAGLSAAAVAKIAGISEPMVYKIAR